MVPKAEQPGFIGHTPCFDVVARMLNFHTIIATMENFEYALSKRIKKLDHNSQAVNALP